MVSLDVLLIVAAFVCFAIEAWRSKSLIAVGLALWTASLVF
jgi:hypothetical protein